MSKNDIKNSDDKFEESDIFDKNDYRYVFCRACGSEMRRSGLLICADCLDDRCDDFLKAASEDDEQNDDD